MSDTYKINIEGYERDLPICKVNDKLSIGAFIMFSDVEITEVAAKALLKRAPDFDVILTAESKGIPLAYEMSRESGKPYVVGRKSVKVYMNKPICSGEVDSITTKTEQALYLGEDKANMLKSKKVLIADDVISTGSSLNALEELVNKAGGTIAAKVAVLAEGDATDRKDIIFLQKLPLFPIK